MFTFLYVYISIITAFQIPDAAPWTKLLDMHLSQWDTYLSYRHRPGYTGQHPVDDSGQEVIPVGWNASDQMVFTMQSIGGEPVLRVSGELYGCLISKSSFRNYHLKLQVKWGTQKWPPREELLRDAGILYHSQGEPGVDYWRSWMLSQEFQIMEGHMGDYWCIANSAMDVRAYLPEGMMNPVADVSQPFLSLGAGTNTPGFCLRSANYELPDVWNTLELICYEGNSLHIVNGHVVMVLSRSRYFQAGQEIPLQEGKLQIQSEAAEVFIRSMEIREISAIPEAYAGYLE